jgi:hypothetical protein
MPILALAAAGAPVIALSRTEHPCDEPDKRGDTTRTLEVAEMERRPINPWSWSMLTRRLSATGRRPTPTDATARYRWRSCWDFA